MSTATRLAEIENALRFDGQVIDDADGLTHIAAYFEFPKEGRAGFFKLCSAVISFRATELGFQAKGKLMWDGKELSEGAATCFACLARALE